MTADGRYYTGDNAPRALELVRAEVRARIKAEAGQRVLAVAPLPKQNNANGRGVETALAALEALAAAGDFEAARQAVAAVLAGVAGEIAEGAAMFATIKAIRAYSDALELALDGCADVEAVAALEAQATGWPGGG